MHLFIFSIEKMYYLHKMTSAVSCVKPNASQWEATLRDRRIYRRKFLRYPIRRRITYASALEFCYKCIYFLIHLINGMPKSVDPDKSAL